MPAFTPWYIADKETVARACTAPNWTTYGGASSTDVATAADAPDSPGDPSVVGSFSVGSIVGMGRATTAKPLPGTDQWSFGEGVMLFDGRPLVTAGAPGFGGESEPQPAGYLFTDYESDAGSFTGRARVAFTLEGRLDGDRLQANPRNYTGWYDNSAHFEARVLPGWTIGADDFAHPSSVLFSTGWQSAADLLALPRVLHQALDDFDATGDMQPGDHLFAATGDFFDIDLGDARVAIATHLDWQADHHDMGMPALSGSPPAVRQLITNVWSAFIQLEYQPPRYRYALSATPPLRQRQRATGLGAAAGPPLRQRQNSDDTKPTLRQRQNG